MVSWVIMGKPYPVTETPFTLKAKVPGFDSHFAMVHAKFGTVLKPSDPPGYDEIVVFDKKQVLPHYIFHYRKCTFPLHHSLLLLLLTT